MDSYETDIETVIETLLTRQHVDKSQHEERKAAE